MHGRAGHRHRPAGHAAGQRRLDPRGHPVPDAAPRVRAAAGWRAGRRATPAAGTDPDPRGQRRRERRRHRRLELGRVHRRRRGRRRLRRRTAVNGAVGASHPGRSAGAGPAPGRGARGGRAHGAGRRAAAAHDVPFVHTRLGDREALFVPLWVPVGGHVVSVVVGLRADPARRPAGQAQADGVAGGGRAVRRRCRRPPAQGPAPDRDRHLPGDCSSALVVAAGLVPRAGRPAVAAAAAAVRPALPGRGAAVRPRRAMGWSAIGSPRS